MQVSRSLGKLLNKLAKNGLFFKFKFLFALKLNFNGGSFKKINIKTWLFQKVEKRHNKIIKIKVENF